MYAAITETNCVLACRLLYWAVNTARSSGIRLIKPTIPWNLEDAHHASSFFISKGVIRMIKRVSIQLNQSLICGGVAIMEQGGERNCIYFDVVKSDPIRVIVGNRGKQVSEEDADMYEKALFELFIKHHIPLKLGTFTVPA